MQPSTLVAVSAVILALAGRAAAAVTVLGDVSAARCSQAAVREQADAASLQVCTSALQDEMLNQHDQAGTYVNRGVLQMVRRDYVDARLDFDHAIKIDPSLGAAWVNRGAVNIAEKRYQDGISDIDKGLALGAGEPAKAYYNRGIADEAIDDEKSAYLDYQQASTLEPNWALPRQELLRFTVTRR